MMGFVIILLGGIIIAKVIVDGVFGTSPTEDDRCRGGHDF